MLQSVLTSFSAKSTLLKETKPLNQSWFADFDTFLKVYMKKQNKFRIKLIKEFGQNSSFFVI